MANIFTVSDGSGSVGSGGGGIFVVLEDNAGNLTQVYSLR
jgi:hypothetical protein